jgi:hypothetical protein
MTEGVMNIFKAWVEESGFDIEDGSLSDLNQKINSLIASEQKKQAKPSKKDKPIKDSDAPKRGKSAYIFFCNDYRAIVKSELGDDLKTTEITKELGARWNKLKESTKASDKKLLTKYEKMATDDKDRYEKEKSDSSSSDDDSVKVKKTKKPTVKKAAKKEVEEDEDSLEEEDE